MSRRQILLVGGGIVVAVLLAVLVEDIVQVALVTPLLYTFWFVRLLFESVPQRIVLAFVFIIATLLAWRSLVTLPGPVHAQRAPTPVPQGRVATWVRLLHRAEREPYAAWILAQHVAQLGQDVLAHEERVSSREVRQRLASGALAMSPEVRTTLRKGIDSYRRPASNPLLLLNRKRAGDSNVEIERVIAFLEARMREDGGGERDS